MEPSLFMLKTDDEINLFFKGVIYFNKNEYSSAHHSWETLWKNIGNNPRRLGLKVFLQLIGIYENLYLNKLDSVRYLIKTSSKLLAKNKEELESYVEVEDIANFLKIYKDKKISLKVIDELKIKRNGVEFTKTSELSERLPLPHTKGTKPAP